MNLTTNMEDMRAAVYACLKCNECTYGAWPKNQTICPLYAQDRNFVFSAGGLVSLARAVLKGQTDYSEALSSLAFTCAACGACDSKCVIVRSINPVMALSDIIRLLRYELVKRNLVPQGPIKRMYEQANKNGDLPGKELEEVVKVPDEVKNGRSDTLLVAECMHTDSDVSSFNAAVALLGKMKKQVALFSNPGCCGSTLYDFGFWDGLRGLVEKRWQKVRDSGKKKLLFVNPHCQEFMTNKYPKILESFTPFKGQHFSELLLDALNKGKLKSKKIGKVKVSYHDPCFLGRGLGIYEAPRKALTSLYGVELVEMERNRELSFCCGARAQGTYFENFAEKTARKRIDEFLETRADLLITACAHCKDAFRRVMGADANRVRDLIELVNERVE